MDDRVRAEVERAFSDVINRYSLENLSNTPDHVLAKMVVDYLLGHARVVKDARNHGKCQKVMSFLSRCQLDKEHEDGCDYSW